MTVIFCMVCHIVHCASFATSNINAGEGSFFFFLKKFWSSVITLQSFHHSSVEMMGQLNFQVIGLSCFRSRTERCGERFEARPGEGLRVDDNNVQWRVGGVMLCDSGKHTALQWQCRVLHVLHCLNCTALVPLSFMTSCCLSLYPINSLIHVNSGANNQFSLAVHNLIGGLIYESFSGH